MVLGTIRYWLTSMWTQLKAAKTRREFWIHLRNIGLFAISIYLIAFHSEKLLSTALEKPSTPKETNELEEQFV
jgi:hypothetical protein